MSGPTIEGVPCQTVMKVCERTMVLGAIVRRTPTNIFEATVMGTTFRYFEERSETTIRDNYYGRIGTRKVPAVRRVLIGQGWRCYVDHLVSKSESGGVTYVRNATGQYVPEPKPVLPGALLWGKTYYDFRARGFEGDAEVFRTHMLYAQMIGDDNGVWDSQHSQSG